MPDDDVGPLLPGPGFRRRSVVLEPGESRPSGDAEWRDALVIVERGDVELECSAGGRRRFCGGAVLWLEGIDLRVLHNVGDGPVVLLAVSRRRDEHPPQSHDVDGVEELLAADRAHVWHPCAAMPAALPPLPVASAQGMRP